MDIFLKNDNAFVDCLLAFDFIFCWIGFFLNVKYGLSYHIPQQKQNPLHLVLSSN